jgi:dihydrofolate synthase/folylpolyglutamate synthase
MRSSPDVLLDVGHNELAAQALAAFLQDSGRRDTICVLAMLADKSAEAVARVMAPVCKRWLCADSTGPRGQSGERLGQRIKSVLPDAGVVAFGPLGDALCAALSSARADETILVFGSFTTVAAAAEWLQHVGHDAARISVDAFAKPGREITNG